MNNESQRIFYSRYFFKVSDLNASLSKTAYSHVQVHFLELHVVMFRYTYWNCMYLVMFGTLLKAFLLTLGIFFKAYST